MSEPIDLGYGTTVTWNVVPVPAAIWIDPDGTRAIIPQRWLQALALSLIHGQAEAAHRMHVQPSTLKNMLTRLYKRLGTYGRWEAAHTLGWLSIPADLLDDPPMGPDPSGSQGGRSVAGPHSGAAAGTAAPTTTTTER